MFSAVCGVHCNVIESVPAVPGWTSQPLANPSMSVECPEVPPAAVDGGLPSLVDALAQHQPVTACVAPVTLRWILVAVLDVTCTVGCRPWRRAPPGSPSLGPGGDGAAARCRVQRQLVDGRDR